MKWRDVDGEDWESAPEDPPRPGPVVAVVVRECGEADRYVVDVESTVLVDLKAIR